MSYCGGAVRSAYFARISALFRILSLPIVERLNREAVKAVQRPDVSSRLALDGTEAVGSSPEQFAAFLKNERDQWGKAAKVANIRNE